MLYQVGRVARATITFLKIETIGRSSVYVPVRKIQLGKVGRSSDPYLTVSSLLVHFFGQFLFLGITLFGRLRARQIPRRHDMIKPIKPPERTFGFGGLIMNKEFKSKCLFFLMVHDLNSVL